MNLKSEHLAVPAPPSPRCWAHNLPGCVFACACLVWVFYSVDLKTLWQNVGNINWLLVVAAVVLDAASYVIQGLRWSLLLRPAGRVSALQATEAVYAGLFVNEVLPMKAGELARGLLVSRLLKTGFLTILPSMVVERFFDGIWLLTGTALTARFISLPANLHEAGELFGAIIILAAGVFLLLVKLGGKSTAERNELVPQSFPANYLIPVKTAAINFGNQIRLVGWRAESLTAFLLSLVLILLQAASFLVVMRAYHIEISIWESAAVFFIVHLGSALPATPANVGSYQFFTVLGLTLFGVEKTSATGFSLVVFIILTIPLWIIGFLALSRSGLTLSSLRVADKEVYPSKHSSL